MPDENKPSKPAEAAAKAPEIPKKEARVKSAEAPAKTGKTSGKSGDKKKADEKPAEIISTSLSLDPNDIEKPKIVKAKGSKNVINGIANIKIHSNIVAVGGAIEGGGKSQLRSGTEKFRRHAVCGTSRQAARGKSRSRREKQTVRAAVDKAERK